MLVSAIVAVSENNVIGRDGHLPWHLSADLKRFKAITTGHTILMGSNTWFSLPKRPLPDRQNIVITCRTGAEFEGAVLARSIDEAVALLPDADESFVIGGASIYRQMFPLATRLYLTLIHKRFEADTFFPEIDYSQWRELERVDIEDDAKTDFKYTYLTLEKIVS